MNAPQQKFEPATPSRPPFAGWLGATNDITGTFLAAQGIPGLINLGGGLPEPTTFPVAELADLAREAVLSHPGDCLPYGPVAGLPELRDGLAERFSTAELRLSRDNVLVTTAGMQGLDLIGKILIDEGSLVAAQFPTYLGALDAWRPRQPAYRTMVLEDPAFDPLAAFADARFAYTVPNFSNPTGRLVGLAMRRRLVEASERTGTWLVEDDPYGALHYDGPALPSLLALSAARRGGRLYDGPVAYMGTLSKQVVPGLRIGWVVAAPDFIAALTAAKQGSDMCTSGLTQRIALGALESGLAERMAPVIVALYRERRDALCEALERRAGAWLSFQRPVGGMFVWATLKDARIDTDRLLATCLAKGVCVSPSSVFDAYGRDTRSLRLNFTLNPPEQLDEAVRRLVTAIEALAAGESR